MIELYNFDPFALDLSVMHPLADVLSHWGSGVTFDIEGFFGLDDVKVPSPLFQAIPGNHDSIVCAVLGWGKYRLDIKFITDLKKGVL